MKTRSFSLPLWSGIVFLSAVLAMTDCKSADHARKKSGAPSQIVGAAAGKHLPDSVRILAATYPVAWLGCQIAGAPCAPIALVPPGASAHSWEPKPSDLEKLDRATFFVQSGLAFEESWIPRFRSTVPDLEVLDVREGLDLRSTDHDNHTAKHSSEESDPHVWSSPRAMDRMAEILAGRLLLAHPELGPRISEHLPELHRKLLELDTAVRQLLAPYSGRTFLVNHPGLGYLARDYGLVQKPLESHGQELTPVVLWEIRRTAKAQGIKAVFVQNEYSRRTAEQVAKEIGVGTVDIDLLGEGPYDSLFMVGAKAMADKL